MKLGATSGAGLVAIALTLAVVGCDGQVTATPTVVPPTPTPFTTPQPTVAATPTPTALPPPAPPAPTPTMGTTGRVVNASAGYAMTLADGWERIDMTTDLAALLAHYIVDQTKLGNLTEMLRIRLEQLFNSGATMFALRVKDLDAEFVANVNILRLPAAGQNMDALEALNLEQLRQIAVDGEVTHTRLQLPAGEALQMSYKVDYGAITAKLYQYMFLANNYQFIVTFTAKAGDKTLADEARTMAESFEFLGAH